MATAPEFALSMQSLCASGVASIAFAGDGSRLYAALTDGSIAVFETAGGTQMARWQIGTSLGAISMAQDGRTLLAIDNVPEGGFLHVVDLATGQSSGFASGGRLHDVQVVDGSHALLTGDRLLMFDMARGSFAAVEGAAEFAPTRGMLVEDDGLTLFAQWNSPSGNQFVFDAAVGAVTATGGNDQGDLAPGYNFGHMAISAEAGLALQFGYFGWLNVYDLALNPLGVFDLGGRVDGLAFDPWGAHFYVWQIDRGTIEEYDAATFELTGSQPFATSLWHNNAGFADQLVFSPDGAWLAVHDSKGGGLSLIAMRGETLVGGSGADDLIGTARGEILWGQAGDDRLLGEGGDDQLKGGSGRDRLEGGAGNDWLKGHDGGDWLYGGSGADVLKGADGRDLLSGGDGDDLIEGGRSADRLMGGAGADVFRFFSREFGSTNAARCDRILDFSGLEGDVIDLSGVDADRTAAGNQAFSWIGGQRFSGDAGELQVLQRDGYILVRGDLDGDGDHDFALRVHTGPMLAEADFLL